MKTLILLLTCAFAYGGDDTVNHYYSELASEVIASWRAHADFATEKDLEPYESFFCGNGITRKVNPSDLDLTEKLRTRSSDYLYAISRKSRNFSTKQPELIELRVTSFDSDFKGTLSEKPIKDGSTLTWKDPLNAEVEVVKDEDKNFWVQKGAQKEKLTCTSSGKLSPIVTVQDKISRFVTMADWSLEAKNWARATEMLSAAMEASGETGAADKSKHHDIRILAKKLKKYARNK